MKLAMPQRVEGLQWLNSQVAVCDYIVSGWTASQAEVAAGFLEPRERSQLDIARMTDRRQQAVSRIYRDGGVDVLLSVLKVVESLPLEDLIRATNQQRQ